MPLRTDRPRGLPPTLAAFQNGLRKLHQRAGEPPFREMSERAHYSASTLCRVLSQPRTPTLSATRGFVIGCRGDDQLWTEHHHRLVDALKTGKVIREFETGSLLPPWPRAHVWSNVLALAERHMAVSLSAATLLQSLKLLPEVLPHGKSKLRRRLNWDMLETLRFVQSAATPRLYAMRMREARRFSGFTLREISERTTFAPIAAATGKPRLSISTLSDLCNPRRGRFPQRATVEGFLMAINAPPKVVEVWVTMLYLAEASDEADIARGLEEWMDFAQNHRTTSAADGTEQTMAA